jgi:hypothetical protein
MFRQFRHMLRGTEENQENLWSLEQVAGPNFELGTRLRAGRLDL